MKKLSLKNRLSPTVAGLFVACLGIVAAPSIARADVKESWELGVDGAKWKASSSTAANTYSTPGAGPITVRSSIADDGAGAACAGKYVRETDGVSGGRVFGVGANVQPVTAGATYCLSAWTRTAGTAVPYIGLVYTGAAGLADPSDSTATECWLLSSDAGYVGPGCPAETIAVIPRDGTWKWTAKTFVVPAGRTHAQVKFVNFPPDAVRPLPAIDFDDIRLTAGACPAGAPADTAPHVACAGNTPICAGGDAATNAKCMDCTGNAGAAAPARACPATTPVCETAGANKGSCKVSCTGDFGSAGATPCTDSAPFCVDIAGTTPVLKQCKPCAGNNGSTTMPACPVANPTCFTTGTKAGSCGKCTAQADCGGATPRCDIGTGRCTDDCEADADCGDKKSGKICLASTLKCTDGCRGDAAGNGCPDGSKCSSVDLKPGTCTPVAPPPPDAGPKPDASTPPVDDAGVITPPPGDDAGVITPPGETPAADSGGCSVTPGSAGGAATMFAGFGLLCLAIARRRRRD